MTEKPVRKNDFTRGSIPAAIMRQALPMIAAQIVNALYFVVDRIYIGHLPQVGTIALAGVGLVFPMLLLVSAFSMLAGMGGAPLCSIARGEGNVKKAEQIMGCSMALLLCLSIIVMTGTLLIRNPLLLWLGADDSVLPYSIRYVTIYLHGSVFVMITLGMNPFINSQGFPGIGMMTVVIGAIANIILDPVFMYVLHMGIEGAAVATVISQAFSAIWILRFLCGKRCIVRLRRENIRLNRSMLTRIMGLGTANCVMNITECIVSIACNKTLAIFGGVTYLGVNTVINSVRQVLMMPVNGFGQGMQPVMGYNYGAKRYDRVRQCVVFTMIVSGGCTILITLCTELFPQMFFTLFNDDAYLAQIGAPALRVYFCMFFMMTLQIAGQNAFVALGKSKQAIFFSLLRKAFIVAPLAILLPRLTRFGVMGVFMAEPISDFIGSSACFITFICTSWVRLGHGEKA